MRNRHVKRYRLTALFQFVFILLLVLSVNTGRVSAAENSYHHLVVLGDPHLPGKNLADKERVLTNINSWSDVALVVAVGDICEDIGTTEEYEIVNKFFAGLEKPLAPIVGNHDFIYADSLNIKGKRDRGTAESRQLKLERFKTTFALKDNYYSRTISKYRLIFLSLDSAGSLAELSSAQLNWLRSELKANQKQPTIIFCHAPLAGTLRDCNKNANTRNFIIQPEKQISELLAAYQQVFLWVSGHTHTSPKEESFSSAVNLYQNQITNIHNTDMNRATIWTNSLFLYSDKVVIRTYNHRHNRWEPGYERNIALPRFLEVD
jgi:3',5'-cyclic-AMP phosphodiesterase